MRLFACLAAAAIAIAACGGGATTASPAPTTARTTAPTTAPTVAATPSPTPAPTPANTFKAELKASNQNPPIADAEASCAGTATITFTGTSAKFDVVVAGCPATTQLNIAHIHEGATGVNGPVRISTDLKAGDLTLTGGGVTFTRTVTGDAAIISQIMANPAGWYFNIHSTLHGGGVVRGQLTKA